MTEYAVWGEYIDEDGILVEFVTLVESTTQARAESHVEVEIMNEGGEDIVISSCEREKIP